MDRDEPLKPVDLAFLGVGERTRTSTSDKAH